MESESKTIVVDIRLRVCGVFLCYGDSENPVHERIRVFTVPTFMKGKSEQVDFSSFLVTLKNAILAGLKAHPEVEEVVLIGLGRTFCLLKDDEILEPFYLVDERANEKLYETSNLQISYRLRYDYSGGEEGRDGSFYRLIASLQKGKLHDATDFLYPIEYLYFLLTGEKAHTRSLARTNGFIDARNNAYSVPLVHGAGIPLKLLPELSRDFTPSALTNPEYTEFFGKPLRIRLGGSRNYSASFLVPSFDDALFIRLGDSPCIGSLIQGVAPEDELRDKGFRFGYANHHPTLERRLRVSNLIYKFFRETKRNYTAFEEAVKASKFEGRIPYLEASFNKAESIVEEVKLYFRSKEKPAPETEADVLRCLYFSFIDFVSSELKKYQETFGVYWGRFILINAESLSPFLQQEMERLLGKDVAFYPLPVEVDGAYVETLRVRQEEAEEEAHRRELEE